MTISIMLYSLNFGQHLWLCSVTYTAKTICEICDKNNQYYTNKNHMHHPDIQLNPIVFFSSLCSFFYIHPVVILRHWNNMQPVSRDTLFELQWLGSGEIWIHKQNQFSRMFNQFVVIQSKCLSTILNANCEARHQLPISHDQPLK